jgi:hypothetical protein
LFVIRFNGVPVGYIIAGVLTFPILLHPFGRGMWMRLLRQVSWVLVLPLTAIAVGATSLLIPANPVITSFTSASVVCLTYFVAFWLIAPRDVRQVAGHWMQRLLARAAKPTVHVEPQLTEVI